MQTPTPQPFTITAGKDTTLVTGRPAAIAQAKQLSRRSHGPIRIERKDGRVMMEFQRGRLEAYAFETRAKGH